MKPGLINLADSGFTKPHEILFENNNLPYVYTLVFSFVLDSTVPENAEGDQVLVHVGGQVDVQVVRTIVPLDIKK